MKLAKLSLAAIVVAGLASSSFAADTLADAFKNGKVNGELKAYYFDRDGGGGHSAPTAANSNIFTPGVLLTYVTDPLMGFKMGLTFQNAQAPFVEGTNANGAVGTAMRDFRADMYGTGSVLSEAYLNYAFGKTNVKVGRQFISTPLIAGSGSRITVQSFEGALISNADLPQTTITAGAVTKYQNRTDVGSNGAAAYTGKIGNFYGLNADNDHAYTLLAVNKSITGLTLTGQYLTLDGVGAAKTGGFQDIYLEAAYAGKAAGLDYGLAANYLNVNFEQSGVKSVDMYGAMVSLGMGDLKGFVAYTGIDKGDATATSIAGALLGSGAQPAYAKGISQTAGYYGDDSRSFSVDVNYNFKQAGVLAGARYTDVKDKNAAATVNEFGITDLYATYTVEQLKGLSFTVNYQDYTKDAEGQDIWFKANYKF